MRRAAIALFCILTGTAPSSANGWEFGAVPFEALLAGLERGAAFTRQKAAESLRYRGQPEAVPSLLRALGKPEPAPNVRRAIYLALGALGGEGTRAPLLACLDEEAREEVRADCAIALGALGGETGWKKLITVADSDEHVVVRSRAIDALGGFGEADVVKALVALVEPGAGKRPNRALRPRAIRSLGRTGHADAGRFLGALLAGTEPPERQLVIEALAGAPDPSAAGQLREIAGNAASPEERAAAAVAIARLGEDDARSQLESLLGDSDMLVRVRAVQGLEVLGDADATPALRALVLDLLDREQAALSEPLTVTSAAQLLEEMPLAERALRAILALNDVVDPEPFLRAASLVGEPDYPQLRPPLRDLRRIGVYGLGYTNIEAAGAALRGARGLSSDVAEIRAAAIRSLGVLDDRAAVEAIARMLAQDMDANVRLVAARVLGLMAACDAVPALMDALRDRHGLVRTEAARALGLLKASEALDALKGVLVADESERARAAAGFSIGLINR